MPVQVTRSVQFWRIYTKIVDGQIDLIDRARLCQAVSEIYAQDDRYLKEPDSDVQITAKLVD